MTQDEIMEMARQAGLFTHKEVQPEIMAFAKLVVEKALAQRTEQNFCSRCGKRTADLTLIHTCTPPKD